MGRRRAVAHAHARDDCAARALRAGAGSAQAPFVVRLGKGEKDGLAAEGQIAAVLDLGLLGGLATRFPWVSSIGGGTVRADATAAAGTGLSVTWKVEGTDLAFTPGELSTKGFTERRVVASGSYEQPAQGDGGRLPRGAHVVVRLPRPRRRSGARPPGRLRRDARGQGALHRRPLPDRARARQGRRSPRRARRSPGRSTSASRRRPRAPSPTSTSRSRAATCACRDRRPGAPSRRAPT